MTLLDANILLYANNESAAQHGDVMKWLKELFETRQPVGLSWLTLWAFLRVTTNSRVWPHSISAAVAWELVHEWLAQPGVVLIHPGPRHADILEKLMVGERATGPLVSDAALAALAIEHGAVLASADRDFSRFPGLRWINPIPR
jgi:uncharacterized protein